MPAIAMAGATQLVAGKAGKKIWNLLKKGWGLVKKGASAVTKNRDLIDTALGGNDSKIIQTPIGTVAQSPNQAKSNSMLLYGGLGLAAILFLKK
jgi:hypothetical protein